MLEKTKYSGLKPPFSLDSGQIFGHLKTSVDLVARCISDMFGQKGGENFKNWTCNSHPRTFLDKTNHIVLCVK